MIPVALIIEDDPKLSYIFATALELAGFKTKTTTDGRLAWSSLQTVKPDLVTLDLHLPNVSGKEILEKIRADEQLAQTVVIITTADVLAGVDLENLADFILLKPVKVDQLCRVSGLLYSLRKPK
jgi:DNA-binding response OmpR family regulator